MNYVPAQLYRSPVDDLAERDDAKPKEKAKQPAQRRDKIDRAHGDAAFHIWILATFQSLEWYKNSDFAFSLMNLNPGGSELMSVEI